MAAAPLTLDTFALDAYLAVLKRLVDTGWRTATVTEMPERRAGTAYLRHDVDFQLAAVDPMADAEAEAGVRSTYYLLLTGPYNVLSGENRRRVRRLVERGHEVGLHYDLVAYPSAPEEARARLGWECGVLADVAGAPVRTVCMHQPSMGEDTLRDVPGLVHPHDRAWAPGLTYVSDSCRTWGGRDEHAGAERLLLNTHPELWLDGSISDRMRYLDQVVLPLLVEPGRVYVEGVVRDLWLAR